jgi:hypothetical protein
MRRRVSKNKMDLNVMYDDIERDIDSITVC